MEDGVGRALDATVFSSSASTATAPAGILNGVSALTATAGGGLDALSSDLAKLAGAIHAAGGGRNLAVFAAPAQATAISVLAPQSGLVVVTAPSLAAGTVIMVDLDAFASGFSGDPVVDVARDATLQMDDAPADTLSATGSPNTVQAPIRSTFQTATWSLRVILRAAYAVRLPGAVQYITGATF